MADDKKRIELEFDLSVANTDDILKQIDKIQENYDEFLESIAKTGNTKQLSYVKKVSKELFEFSKAFKTVQENLGDAVDLKKKLNEGTLSAEDAKTYLQGAKTLLSQMNVISEYFSNFSKSMAKSSDYTKSNLVDNFFPVIDRMFSDSLETVSAYIDALERDSIKISQIFSKNADFESALSVAVDVQELKEYREELQKIESLSGTFAKGINLDVTAKKAEEAEKVSKKSELEKARENVEKANEEKKALKAENKALSSEVSALKKELSASDKKVQNAETASKADKEKLAVEKEKTKSLQAENKALSSQITSLEKEDASSKKKLEQAQKSLDTTKTHLTKSNERNKLLKNENKALSSQISDLQKDLNESEKRASRTEASYQKEISKLKKETQKQIQYAEDEKNKIQAKAEKIVTEEKEKRLKQVEKVNAEKETLRTKLEGRIEDLTTKYESSLSKEQDKLAKATSNYEKKLADSQEKADRKLASQQESYEKRVDSLRSQLEKEKAKNTAKVNDKDSYDKEIDSVTAHIRRLEELSKLVKNITSKDVIYTEDMSTAFDALEKEINEAADALERLDNKDLSKKLRNSIADAKYSLGTGKENQAGRLVVPGSSLDPKNIKKYSDARKQFDKTVGSELTGIYKTSWNIFKTTGKTSISFVSGLFKGLGKTAGSVWNLFGSRGKSTTSMIENQLRNLAGLFSIYSLVNTGKEAITLSSDMIEVRNVIQGVFGEASQDVEDFSKSAIKNFGLTQLQATKMIGVFGGMLEASNIVGDAQSVMSKNLTALSGDLASFYNMPVDDVFTKLKSGLAGETEPLRAFGVNMTVANLEAYALSKGIDASWQSMNQATQQTLRYNYILEHLATAQGDFARTSNTWANQVRLLSSNFQQLLSILGGGAIQVLYPIVKILNQIVSLAIQASSRMANMFGFDYQSLESQFGVGSNLSDIGTMDTGMEIDTSGIDDYTDSTNKAADATKNFSDSTENAGDNLQSFDKINNITTDSMKNYDDVADSTKGLEDALDNLGGSSLIEPLSYFENVEAPGEYVNGWLDEWIDLLEDKRWYEAGNKLAKLISKGLGNVYDVLSDEETLDKAEEFGTGLGEFFNGIVDETDMFLNFGKTLGAGINLFTTFYNSFFDTADFKQFGKSFAIGIKGLVNEVDGKELGKALTQTFRAAIDFIAGAIEDETAWEDTGELIGDVINGAIENIDPSTAIPTLVGLAGRLFQTLGVAFEEIKWEELSAEITEGINTSIEEIDPKEFGTTLGNMVLDLLKVLNGVLDSDWGEAGEKLGDSINALVDTGAPKEFAKTATRFVGKFLELLINAVGTVEWKDLLQAIWEGITEAYNDFDPDTKTVVNVLLGILGVTGGIGGIGKLITTIGGFAGSINEIAAALRILFGVMGEKPAGTVADAIGDVAGATGKSGLLKKLASVGYSAAVNSGAIAGAPLAVAGFGIYHGVQDVKSTFEYSDKLIEVKENLYGVSESAKEAHDSLASLSGDTFNFDYENVTDAAVKVREVADVFSNMKSNVKDFITRNGDLSNTNLLDMITSATTMKTLKENAKEVADALREIGDEANYLALTDVINNGSKKEIATALNNIRTEYSNYVGALSTLTDTEINKINNSAKTLVVEFANGAGDLVKLAGDTIVGIYRDAQTNIDYLITASGSAFNTSTQSFTKVTDKMRENAVSAVNGVTGVFNSDGSVSEAALNLANNASMSTISGFNGMKVNASNAVTETANEIINSSSELTNAVGSAIDAATSGNMQKAESKGKEIGDRLRDSVERSFINNPLNIYANLDVDTSNLKSYTVPSGLSNVLVPHSRRAGTALGYGYSSEVSPYTTMSAFARSIAPVPENIDTYGIDTSKFSSRLTKTASSFRASSPNVMNVSPRNLETVLRMKVEGETDYRTLEKLTSIVSSMRDMRSVGNEGDQIFYITIGNREIDDYIVEVERRNNFRLGR